MYRIEFSRIAIFGVEKLRKNEPRAYKKLEKLLEEIALTPFKGTGKLKQLRGCSSVCWSRRITSKHRLVYSVLEKEIKIIILSSYGHYEDR